MSDKTTEPVTLVTYAHPDRPAVRISQPAYVSVPLWAIDIRFETRTAPLYPRLLLEHSSEPESDADFLRSLARNDYMIDQNFLPEGQRLNAIACRLAAPSPQTTEPVAWMARFRGRYGHTDWTSWTPMLWDPRFDKETEWEAYPLYAAAPSPQTTPLPAGFRDIREVIAERESTLEGKAAMDAARARLPQATPTQDEIMRLADDSVGCYWPSGRAALAAAVGRLVAERDEWETAHNVRADELDGMRGRAEKAEQRVRELEVPGPNRQVEGA